MNELEQQEFDYSLVDNEIANKLKKYDEQLNRLYNNYTIEVGEILYNANKEFSNPKDGTFIKWVEYKGFKRQSAYNYMSVYKAFQNLESIDDQKNFLSQPKTLQYEMSKPSANKEANEAVLNGEVKSTKEYKELERKLKQRDEQNAQLQSQVEQAQRSESIARKKLEDEQNREPEVIEKYTEPEDYNQLKQSNQQLQDYLQEVSNHNKQLKSDIEKLKNERSETDEKSAKYDQLNEAINKMNGQLTKGQQKIKAQKEVYDLVRASEKVIKEVSPLCYLAYGKDIVDNEYAREPIERIIKDLKDISNRLQKQINQGDVIDV
ncbi:hypothetical protein LZT70_09390 [Staphylococcus epidermidis]|uniref:hypothetical protein n=1 Tax=Staphylococcus epidermidis TaxID=1282 RepID=UPI002095EB9B|nr:hypothetical protein [Staphylococcus epidermidis]MCO6218434.1 hypothetical protein [Staphylococcus epidermidis]